jgi:hypothetical protein
MERSVTVGLVGLANQSVNLKSVHRRHLLMFCAPSLTYHTCTSRTTVDTGCMLTRGAENEKRERILVSTLIYFRLEIRVITNQDVARRLPPTHHPTFSRWAALVHTAPTHFFYAHQ